MITSSIVCSEFNHSPFTIIWLWVQRIIFNYFKFLYTRLTLKQMQYTGCLFILGLLVFVYSKVSPKHFLHVFKNRWDTLLPLLLNPHLLICSTKVHFLVHCTLFNSLAFQKKLFKYSPKQLSGTSLHSFLEKGIKLFQLLSKKEAVLTQFRSGLFRAAHG